MKQIVYNRLISLLQKVQTVVQITDPQHYAYGKFGIVTRRGPGMVWVRLQDAEYVYILNGFVSDAFWNTQVKVL